MTQLAMLAAAGLMLGMPVSTAAEGNVLCTAERPTGDLKSHAASFFPKANNADLDALAACLGDPDPAVRDDFAFTL